MLRQNRYQEAQVETLAGYQIMVKQTNQSTSFLHSARRDLVAEYEALNRPEMATKFRAELAGEQNRPPAATTKH